MVGQGSDGDKNAIVKKVFSSISVFLMVLITFHVIAYNVEATEPVELESTILESDIKAIDESNEYPKMDECANVSEINEGGIESYWGDPLVDVASIEVMGANNHMTRDNGNICYWTANGTYIFNESTPWMASMNSMNGTEMVSEAYFTVQYRSTILTPSELLDFRGSDRALDICYTLTEPETGEYYGSMFALYEFPEGKAPKITATLVNIKEDTDQWNLIWIVVPNKDAETDSPNIGYGQIQLQDLVGKALDGSVRSFDMSVNNERMLIDWSDAGSGELKVSSSVDGKSGQRERIEVTFDQGVATIDPTFVCTVTNSDPTGVCSQRKTYWNDGYYWLFYNSGTSISYRCSADGITWDSAVSLPEGTTPASSSGFDVSIRNGYVAVGWRDTANVASVKRGIIYNDKIAWTSKVNLCTGASQQPVTVAIGYDNSFWMGYVRSAPLNLIICRSLSTTDSFTEILVTSVVDSNAPANCLWTLLLPYTNGNTILLETSYSSSGSNNPYIRYRYFYGSIGGIWSSAMSWDIGMYNGLSPNYKSKTFSAIASPNGTLHLVYRHNVNGDVKYAYAYPSGIRGTIAPSTAWYYDNPTICLDSGGVLHVFAISNEAGYYIVHMEKNEYGGSWSYEDILYSGSTINPELIVGLTSCPNPVNKCSLAWCKSINGVYTLAFLSSPVPYGTSGFTYDAWNRDGISPYGTYFSENGVNVAPGSGQVTVLQDSVSISGRGGLELGISLVYQQPRYIRTIGWAERYYLYPFCNLGNYWSLDLPWMNTIYLYIGGGQSFIIDWGNEGNIKEFVNHAGSQFVLRDVVKGGTSYYELYMANGMKYRFNHNSPYKLEMISDLRNYDPSTSTATVPYNCYNLTYAGTSPNFILQSITESGLGRSITFQYSSNLLSKIVRPDGKTVNLTYTSGKLTSTTDPKGRVTHFNYTSECNGLLGGVTFPTGGKIVLYFSLDSTPATDTRTWMVTRETLFNGTTVIRRTDFNYKVVNGRIMMTTQSDFNEGGVLQGTTEYMFQSSKGYMIQAQKDASGVQLGLTKSWYDVLGQPVRIDTYLGDSQSINETQYYGYDDWGNRVFTRDALGNEYYYSYANTSDQNSFQGEERLTKTADGRILADTFEDWSFTDWMVDTPSGSTTLDGSMDPVRSPALKVARTSSAGNCLVTHTMAAQSNPFYMQSSYMTSTTTRSYILGLAGASIRVYFSSYNGYFQYYTGSSWINVASCSSNTWYDVGFYVRCSDSTYDIYIDGSLVMSAATLTGSGNIDAVRFQAGAVGASNTNIWFDDIRVYKDSSVTINNLPANAIAELYDRDGDLIDRIKSGSLTVPAMKFDGTLMVKLWKVGYTSDETTIFEVWPGDVYSYSARFTSMNVAKSVTGYATCTSYIQDYPFPSGSTTVNSGSFTWVNDADGSVGMSYYLKGNYLDPNGASPSIFFGFTSSSSTYFSIGASTILTEYVKLESGKIPREIMLQYNINGVWKRAYWGGDLSGNNIIVSTGYTPSSMKYMGAIPSITGKWLQLTVKASDLGVSSTSSVRGILYGTYGGTASWDRSSINNAGIIINGVSSGMKVNMKLSNGTVFSQTASSTSIVMDVYSKIKVFPVKATFEFLDSGGKQLYISPYITEIYNYDTYQYSTSKFYVNQIKDTIHDRPVGMMRYQDWARTVVMDSYVKYDFEGNAIESKSSSGSSWIYNRFGYDIYGNMLWSADPSGNVVYYDYSSSNKYTYPLSTSEGDRIEFFDHDASWTASESPSRTWLTEGYSSVKCYSSSSSIALAFSGASADGQDYGTGLMYKEYYTNKVQKISLRMYLDQYSHAGSTWDALETGVRMRLLDSSGTNYANYSYVLACWYQYSNNKTSSDPSVKIVYGQPNMGAWLNPTFYPNEDWTIDWDRCAKVRFELYVGCSGTYSDTFRMYYDDLIFNDLTAAKTTYAYDNNNGRVTSITDPCGHTKGIQYDYVGRITRITNADGTYRAVQYDDVNNKMTSWDELNQKTVTYYDKIGRAVSEERYGLYASVYSRVKQSYNWQDNVATSTDAMNRVTTLTYDYFGRSTSVRNPDNSISYTTYDDKNRLVTSLDELGHKTVTILDLLGRANQTREYYSASSFYTTTMAYNAAGQLIIVRQDNGEVTRMYYDSLGRQTSIAYPDSKSESYTYDGQGRVLTSTSRSGQVTACAYDGSGNLIRVISSSDTIRVEYNADGLVSKKTNSLGYITYQYNNRDLLYRLVEMVSSNTYTFTMTYNAVGNLIYVDYPDSKRVTYLYDRFNRVVDAKMGTAVLLNQTYNADDMVAVKKYCNANTTMTHYYNTNGYLSRLRAVNTSSGAALMDLNYYYNLDGDVCSIKDTAGSAGNEFYWYDNLGRLTKAMANSTFGTIMYGYSSVGNRIWKNEGSNITYTYGTYSKLTNDGTHSYAYNADGNVIWKNSTSVRYNYIYNSFGQMTEVKKQLYSGGAWGTLSTIARYYYDANGARAMTDEGGVITRYVYSDHDPIYYVSSDGKGHKNIYVGDKLEVQVVSPSEKWSYLTDALGSTRKVLRNGNGGSVTYSAIAYKPFGPAVTTTGSDKFTYTSEMVDPPTGLVYLFARYYDPSIGRFFALDSELGTIFTPQSLNRYIYCINNPLIFTDPDGRVFNLIAAAIGAAAGAIIGGVITYALTGDINAAIGGAIGGAIAGALAGFTCGTSLLAQAAMMSAQGFVSSSVSTLWTTHGDFGKAFEAGLMGAVTGAIGGAIGGKIARTVSPKIIGKLPVGEKDVIGRISTNARYSNNIIEIAGHDYRYVRYDVVLTKQFSTEIINKGFSGVSKKGLEKTLNNIYDYANVPIGVDINRMY